MGSLKAVSGRGALNQQCISLHRADWRAVTGAELELVWPGLDGNHSALLVFSKAVLDVSPLCGSLVWTHKAADVLIRRGL